MTRLVVGYFILIIFISCAKVVAPDGGSKDISPPELVMSEPVFGATNFERRKIELVFNEYIDIRQIENQIIITPPLNQPPIFKLKGKKLSIEFQEKLLENRTYNLQFGEGIKDLNEGNAAPGFQFVFSTGSQLDSAYFQGKAVNAFTKEPLEKGILVLYDAQDFHDSILYEGSPTYLASIKDGEFTANYIREGNYIAFAFEDNNGNYKYEPLSDGGLGFPASTWSTENPEQGEILVSTKTLSPNRPQFNLSGFQKLSLGFDPKPQIDSFKVSSPSQIISTRWNPKKDSLEIFYGSEVQDSILLFTQQNSRMDTLDLRIREGENKSLGLAKRFRKDLFIKNNPKIHFSGLVQEVNPAKFKIFHAKDTLVPNAEQVKLSEDQLSLVIEIPAKEAGLYGIGIYPGALNPLFLLDHDTLEWSYQVPSSESLGKFSFKQDSELGIEFIYQFLSSDQTVLQEFNSESFNLKQMRPGKYGLRRFIDLNGNGQWDPGKIEGRIQPEPMYYYPETIEVRANWEIEAVW